MSVAVRGGAVGYLQEVFNSHWNIAEPTDALPSVPAIPSAPASLQNGEFLADVQVVRTFDSMFSPATDGEKGVLEAYLRAIHLAERFIYIENRTSTTTRSRRRWIDALKRKPALQVILLLNAGPDMPLYMGWQQKAITRIRTSLGDAAAAAKTRVGVFSLVDARVRAIDRQRQAGTGGQLPAHEVRADRQPLGHGRLREPRRRVARLPAVRARVPRRRPAQYRSEPRGVRRRGHGRLGCRCAAAAAMVGAPGSHECRRSVCSTMRRAKTGSRYGATSPPPSSPR